jgi:hypothetical protein
LAGARRARYYVGTLYVRQCRRGPYESRRHASSYTRAGLERDSVSHPVQHTCYEPGIPTTSVATGPNAIVKLPETGQSTAAEYCVAVRELKWCLTSQYTMLPQPDGMK